MKDLLYGLWLLFLGFGAILLTVAGFILYAAFCLTVTLGPMALLAYGLIKAASIMKGI